MALLRVPLRWKPIIAAGTVLAIVLFAVRSLPFTFGIHTAVGIFLLVIVINRATNIAITRIFIAVLVSFLTLMLLELVMHESFFALTKLEPQTFIKDRIFLWTLLGLPQALLMNIFAVLISKLKKPREDAWQI
ncbi:MAG: hypothetical protein PHY77_09135 [Desulfotomaculaceae bacterium]|nr:hypothetical protein [Desulfotomaculaceae bacterium]